MLLANLQPGDTVHFIVSDDRDLCTHEYHLMLKSCKPIDPPADGQDWEVLETIVKDLHKFVWDEAHGFAVPEASYMFINIALVVAGLELAAAVAVVGQALIARL